MVTGPRFPMYENQVMSPDTEKMMVKKTQTNWEQNKHPHLQI